MPCREEVENSTDNFVRNRLAASDEGSKAVQRCIHEDWVTKDIWLALAFACYFGEGGGTLRPLERWIGFYPVDRMILLLDLGERV
jgi:hypothetical protein